MEDVQELLSRIIAECKMEPSQINEDALIADLKELDKYASTGLLDAMNELERKVSHG